jgi:hypothetical protein
MAYDGIRNPVSQKERRGFSFCKYRLVIATNEKAAITNEYHMFACATEIDDITII